ncbi:MAG: shikimate dehydrogenase family protein [Candidatus Dormibacteraceae bacterium]
MRKVALIGSGISYSASPRMQEAAFRAAGLDWVYELWDVPAGGLAEAVRRLHAHEMAGANVTIPHKVSVIDLLDGVEGEAEAAGAVNTVRRERDRLVGSNTDVAGVRAALRETGISPPGCEAVVLGAGGSARAAAVALRGARVTFVARRAGALTGPVVSWEGDEWWALARRADLLLNATPLGRSGELAAPAMALPADGAVIDLVYTAGGTPLVGAARERGLRVADGWTVLAAQGATSFQAWTGRTADLAAMRAALEMTG